MPLAPRLPDPVRADRPTLTIAIPTYNRARFLQLTMERIQAQRSALVPGQVELLVCDNHSGDGTPSILATAARSDPSIRIVRNATNIGPDANMRTCFEQAQGRYVWILGDDDFPAPGLLERLLPLLGQDSYGLVYLRPYGYDEDFDAERPAGLRRVKRYDSLAPFLRRVGAHLTFISSIIVSKEILEGCMVFDAPTENLLQLEIYLAAGRLGSHFLDAGHYSVVCKRNNSGGYDYADVFATRFSAVLRRHAALGLPQAAIDALTGAMLLRYYPQYLMAMRWRRQDVSAAYEKFAACYHGRWQFSVILAPIFFWPRPLALVWGGFWTAVGRSIGGDFLRGLAFAYSALRRRLAVMDNCLGRNG